MRYLLNAFSLAMLPSPVRSTIEVAEVTEDEVEFDVSAVGHPATAEVLAALLGRKVICNRVAITLCPGDIAYVAQLQWPNGRPPEGAVVVNPNDLPPVKFLRVINDTRAGYR